MSGQVGDLTETQVAALDQLRTAVDDILRPEHDDYFLSRFLRARNFNATEAEKMLRNCLQWRERNNIDNVMEDYQAPEVLQKYFPGGLVGHDKEGSPVWIIPFGNLDIKGIFHAVKKSDFIRHVLYLCEVSVQDMKDQTENTGKVIDSHSFIWDMDGFTMKQLAWKPAVDMITHLTVVCNDNYPERLKKAYVINAPQFFNVAFSLIKPFLSEETAKKIHVFPKDKWKPALLEDIEETELPPAWGGSKELSLEDGVINTLNMGGPVPCSYYMAPSRRLSSEQNLQTAVVEKKGTLPVDVEVGEANSVLRWEFQTEGNDIGFGVFRKGESDPENTLEELLPMQRVNSHLVPEDGMMVCDKPGVYVLKFDNSFSWCRKKKLMYQVHVEGPNQPKVNYHNQE